MTRKLLEEAITEVRKLSDVRQDEAAYVLLGLVAWHLAGAPWGGTDVTSRHVICKQ